MEIKSSKLNAMNEGFPAENLLQICAEKARRRLRELNMEAKFKSKPKSKSKRTNKNHEDEDRFDAMIL